MRKHVNFRSWPMADNDSHPACALHDGKAASQGGPGHPSGVTKTKSRVSVIIDKLPSRNS